MFADNTNLFISEKNLPELIPIMNTELTKYMTWMNVNKLLVNVSKTNYMIFRKKRMKIPENIPDLLLNREKLQRVSTVKFLGVVLDDTLTWLPHINRIKNKVSKGIGVISKARKY